MSYKAPEEVEARVDPVKQRSWVYEPYVHLWLSILLSAAAQVFLKLAADRMGNGLSAGLDGLRSIWGLLGILAILASLFSWLHALRSVPLVLAFNLSGLIHVLVPLSCWILLGEAISGTRWVGIALVFAGVVIIARPAAEAEESL